MVNACAQPGRISSSQRKRLPSHAFAIPTIRMFPLYKRVDGKLVPSRTHAINAKARAQQAYNRGELSKSTLNKIDKQADKVIQECKNMAAKRTRKRAASPKKQAMRSKLTKEEIVLLRRIQRTAKAGKEVRKGDMADSTFKKLQSLMRRKYVQSALVRGTYMLTSKGAKAAGVKYFGKNDLKKKIASMRPTKTKAVAKTKSGGTVPRTRKTAKKKTAKKKTAKKKAAKKTAPKKRSVAKKTAKKRPKRRQVSARYQGGKKRGVRVKVSGSKRRVPVEVHDVPEVKNKVLILV